MFTVYVNSSNSRILPSIHCQKSRIRFKKEDKPDQSSGLQYVRPILMKEQYTKSKFSKIWNDVQDNDLKKTIKTKRFRQSSEQPHHKDKNRNIPSGSRQTDRKSPHKMQQIKECGQTVKLCKADKQSANGRSRINSCKVVINRIFPPNKKPLESTKIMNDFQDDALSSIPKLEWDTDKFISFESFTQLAF